MFHSIKIKCLLSFILFVLFIPNVNAIIKPTDEFYVNDYANILSADTENYIIQQSKKLFAADGTQIVVATVKSLEGSSIEDYSLNVARSFGIGDKDKNNGILILVSITEREMRIEVGYGLEGILPDGKVGRIRDKYMIPYLKDDKWDEGIKNGYDAVYSEIVTLNHLDLNYNDPLEYDDDLSFSDTVIISIFVTCFITLIIGEKIKKIDKGKVNVLFGLIPNGIVLSLLYVIGLNIIELIIVAVLNLVALAIGLISDSYSSSFISISGGRSSSGGSHGGGGHFGGGGASGKF